MTLKILLIEDDDVEALSFKRAMFSSGTTSDVEWCNTLDAAIKSLEENKYDIIFTDYMLNGDSALDLLAIIESKQIRVPVVVITSQGDERIAVECLKAGATDYVPKNLLSAEGLSQVIRNALKVFNSEVLRLAAEKALAESEKQYRFLVETAHDIIFTADIEGNLKYVNPIAIKLLEFPEEELLTMNYMDLVDESQAQYIRKFYIKQHFDQVELTYKELPIRTKSGKLIWVGQNLKFLYDENKIINGFHAVTRDITELKKMKDELIEARIEAEKSTHAKQEFLANMSHEIRTPLNAIIGFTELLKRTGLDKDQKEFLKAIHISGENLLVIINDILDVSKIESGKMTIEKTSFCLKEIIGLFKLVYIPKAEHKGLRFDLNIDSRIPDYLCGDPVRLNQILVNLIGNAIKFTDNGSIKLDITLQNNFDKEYWVCFEIKDTGIGIPPDKLDSVFKSFTQASTETTRKFGGTGLGLSIVKMLTELMGGYIKVKSELGAGSTFTFMIPMTIGEGSTEEKTSSDPDEIENHLQNARVLLAEDNAMNMLLARKILERYKVFPDCAENGAEVLELMKTNTYDIILMDIQMPVMDGHEAMHHIRNVLHNPVPVIALTAHATMEELNKCFDSGMNEHVSKPFKAEELFMKMQKLLSKNLVGSGK